MAHDVPIEISYFRTRHGLEVDFIVKVGGKYWAIEVKSGDVTSADTTNLIAFRDYFPGVERCIVVSPQEKRRQINGVLICDCVTMLKELGL